MIHIEITISICTLTRIWYSYFLVQLLRNYPHRHLFNILCRHLNLFLVCVCQMVLAPSHTNGFLCIRGNDTERGPRSTNQYAIMDLSSFEEDTFRLPGTTLIAHHEDSDFPSRLHFAALVGGRMLNHVSTQGGFAPKRIMYYSRAGVVTRVDSWREDLMKALMGKDLKTFVPIDGDSPICFQNAVVLRRQLGVPIRHPLPLAKIPTRIVEYCSHENGNRRDLNLKHSGNPDVKEVVGTNGLNNGGARWRGACDALSLLIIETRLLSTKWMMATIREAVEDKVKLRIAKATYPFDANLCSEVRTTLK